jgi:hypothetical protein
VAYFTIDGANDDGTEAVKGLIKLHPLVARGPQLPALPPSHAPSAQRAEPMAPLIWEEPR